MSGDEKKDLLMNPAHIDDDVASDDGPLISPDARAQAEFAEMAVREMANTLDSFFPEKTDKEIITNAVKALNEQVGLGQVLEDASFRGSARTLPGWGVQVGPIAGGPVSATIIPKLTGDVLGMQTAVHWVTVLALVTSPQARAALRLFGYEIKFVQTKSVPGALVRG